MTKAAELAKMGEVLTNSQIGGRRNIIINGAMQVAQRGTSSTTNGFGSVDRFTILYGGGTITHTQSDLSSSDSPYNDGFRKHLRLTTNGGSSAASDFSYIMQNIEAQNLVNSGWNYTSSSSYISVSFWVRSSLAGTYSCVLKSDDGTAKAFVTPVTLSANTWTKFIKVIPGDSGITIDNNNGTGIVFSIRPYSGTNYSDSSVSNNTWYTRSGSTQTPVYSENWQSTSSATFDLTGVQIEVGSQATPFEHRSFGEELALCQRYYQQSYAHGTVAGTATNTNRVIRFVDATQSYAGHWIAFKTEMRVAATGTPYSPGTGTVNKIRSDSADHPAVVGQSATHGMHAYANNSSIGTSNGLNLHYKADAEL